MEHEGTRASSAQGTAPPSPASPPTTTAATTPEAGQRREKKRPPKSSSSQFFTLLSHGATHVQKLVGVEGSGAGGVHHPSLEESHLLGSTHLDDDEHDQVLDATATLNSTTDEDEEREKDGRARRRQRVSVTESTSSRYREEANIRRSSPAQPSVSEPNLTASTERALRAHNMHHRKAASEAQAVMKGAGAPPATAPVPRRKRVKLVPAKKETINRNYFFLREYRSDSDSTSDMSDEEENEDEAKRTEKNSEGENENEKEAKERKRSEDGGRDEENETEEEKESAHKEAEEPGTVVGGSESINWDGAKEKVVKRKQQKAHKKGMSGGWVMKKVLVLMGSADKVKGMVTRNKRHKSRRSRRPRSRHHVVMENTDGEDELYEMVDLHHDVGDEDYDTTDVEACEEVDEVEAQKAREEQAILFLISLCRALHKYGAPAHRLEYNLHRASESLGIEASFAVMPSLILISVGPEDNRRSETHIIRSSQSLNCAKLFWTDDLIARMANNEIELPDAVVELASINRRKPLYPLWLTLLSFGVCSAACAPLFYSGGWIELAFSFGLGLMTGVLNWLSGKIEPLGLLISAVAAILCAFFTRLFIEYVQPICYLPTVLSGIIWLLPGLSITISITELATGNMISGTTRIFSAIITTLQLGFGMTLGMKLVMWTSEANFIALRDSVSCSGIGGPWTIPLFLCVSITFNLLLEAHPRQWGIMMVTALLSLTISEVTAYYGYFSNELASALAAFAVGAVGNIHARISGHPAIVSIIAGVLLLVPGSIGVKGVKSLMEDDVVSGIQFGFSMLTIALSICVGLLTANLFNLGKKHLGF